MTCIALVCDKICLHLEFSKFKKSISEDDIYLVYLLTLIVFNILYIFISDFPDTRKCFII